MKNRLLFIVACLLITTLSWSSNTLILDYDEVVYNKEISFNIDLNNSESISALQFDIYHNPDAIILLDNHQLSSRGSSHTLGVSSPAEGVIRVVIYSASNANIKDSSGSLLTLQLKSLELPGNWNLQVHNIVASSSNSSSIEVSAQTGVVTVLGARLSINDSVLDFDRVQLGVDGYNRYLTVSNQGTIDLEITGSNTISPFSIADQLPIIIQPFSNKEINFTINASSVGTSDVDLIFETNDFDSINQLNKVALKAEVYIANEILLGQESGESNTPIEIPIEIRNTQEFTGFQFDIILPEGITYHANSIVSTSRIVDHSISASVIEGEKLRIIGYSPTNKNFTGNSGDVCTIKLVSSLLEGWYLLDITDAIITNADQENIISDAMDGHLSINSPNLSIDQTAIDLGDFSFTDTNDQKIVVGNNGVGTLVIDSISHANEISIDAEFPLSINVNESQELTLTFIPAVKGVFNDTLVFHDNDPSDHINVKFTANIYMPNTLKVKDAAYFTDDEIWVDILATNYEEFVALQFDLEFQDEVFNYESNSAELTNRLENHELMVADKGDGTLRILIYSLDQTPITGSEGSILRLLFSQATTTEGVFNFSLSNGLLSNKDSQDVLYDTENGTVEISLTVGIEDDLKSEISIFPNPATEKIRIDLGTNRNIIEEINLYDLLGTKYFRIPASEINKNMIEIPCHSMKRGIYLIQFVTNKGNFTKKISVN